MSRDPKDQPQVPSAEEDQPSTAIVDKDKLATMLEALRPDGPAGAPQPPPSVGVLSPPPFTHGAAKPSPVDLPSEEGATQVAPVSGLEDIPTTPSGKHAPVKTPSARSNPPQLVESTGTITVPTNVHDATAAEDDGVVTAEPTATRPIPHAELSAKAAALARAGASEEEGPDTVMASVDLFQAPGNDPTVESGPERPAPTPPQEAKLALEDPASDEAPATEIAAAPDIEAIRRGEEPGLTRPRPEPTLDTKEAQAYVEEFGADAHKGIHKPPATIPELEAAHSADVRSALLSPDSPEGETRTHLLDVDQLPEQFKEVLQQPPSPSAEGGTHVDANSLPESQLDTQAAVQKSMPPSSQAPPGFSDNAVGGEQALAELQAAAAQEEEEAEEEEEEEPKWEGQIPLPEAPEPRSSEFAADDFGGPLQRSMALIGLGLLIAGMFAFTFVGTDTTPPPDRVLVYTSADGTDVAVRSVDEVPQESLAGVRVVPLNRVTVRMMVRGTYQNVATERLSDAVFGRQVKTAGALQPTLWRFFLLPFLVLGALFLLFAVPAISVKPPGLAFGISIAGVVSFLAAALVAFNAGLLNLVDTPEPVSIDTLFVDVE